MRDLLQVQSCFLPKRKWIWLSWQLDQSPQQELVWQEPPLTWGCLFSECFPKQCGDVYLEMDYCSYFMALEGAKWILRMHQYHEGLCFGKEAISCYPYQLQLEHSRSIK